ncbi:MAG: nucleotidyltransferase domain-containing protein [Firmicutes bacterium]|jgi:predicted nucleotidyltransferase|nr:nucleotidyltransferase domain-containing protein [Bacillota bacterium]
MSRVQEILLRKRARELRLKSSLAYITEQLCDLGALKIVLFGSLARGDVDTDSDLDLLVIMPASVSGKEWTDIIYTQVERGIASDIIVYSQDEFESRLPESSFLQDIMASGRVVYEKAI